MVSFFWMRFVYWALVSSNMTSTLKFIRFFYSEIVAYRCLHSAFSWEISIFLKSYMWPGRPKSCFSVSIHGYSDLILSICDFELVTSSSNFLISLIV